MTTEDNSLNPLNLLSEKLQNCYEKPSPSLLYEYYDYILKQSEASGAWDSLKNYHPVITLRILITSLYNPLRIRRLADIVRHYFPRIYYSNPHLTQLIDSLAKYSADDTILLQFLAYLIVQAFSLSADPINRVTQINEQSLIDQTDKVINQVIQDMQSIFTPGDNNCLVIFDRDHPTVESIDSVDLPIFPIPGGDLRFLTVFENMCKNTAPPNNLIEALNSFNEASTHQVGRSNQTESADFMPAILPQEFIEPLMDSYYESLQGNLSPRAYHRFEIFDSVFKFLLTEFFMTNYREINYYDFQAMCKKAGLRWEWVERFILRVDHLEPDRMGDVSFKEYQKLFVRPLLWVKSEVGKQYRYNHIIFSWPILFDAYFSHLVTFYRLSSVGKKRGKLMEDTVASLIKEKLFADPFKLIIINQNLPKDDVILRTVLQQTEDFVFPRIILEVDPNEINDRTFRFREYDVCFYYNSRLYFVETKDNFIVETQDNPSLSLKWCISNLKKIRYKEKLLKNPIIQQKLEQRLGYTYFKPKGYFVSNISFSIFRCFSLPEFQDHLADLQIHLQFDPVRKKILSDLNGSIKQSGILHDHLQESKFIRQAFNLTMLCRQYKLATEYGMKLLNNIDRSLYYEDKLLISLQLAEAYGFLGKYGEAINILNRAQYNIQLKTEPELGFVYFFNRGKWLEALDQKETALADLLEAERIARGKDLDIKALRHLYAHICNLLSQDSPYLPYYQQKMLSLFSHHENLDELIARFLKD